MKFEEQTNIPKENVCHEIERKYKYEYSKNRNVEVVAVIPTITVELNMKTSTGNEPRVTTHVNIIYKITD